MYDFDYVECDGVVMVEVHSIEPKHAVILQAFNVVDSMREIMSFLPSVSELCYQEASALYDNVMTSLESTFGELFPIYKVPDDLKCLFVLKFEDIGDTIYATICIRR